MGTSVISEIEESILALPEKEQLRLISRVAETLRRRRQPQIDAQLIEMANDPDIQREIREIERDFTGTEFDGLPE
ncbi:hypothetical protein BH20ACI2_BH20ACI2_02000 [soil metagenome]